MSDQPTTNAALFADIDVARHRSAVALNAELVMTYWRIGQRIRQDILAAERAEYDKAIVSTLSRQLSGNYGQGYSAKNLHRMVQFVAVFPDAEKVATIELVPFQRTDSIDQAVSAPVLSGNLSPQGMERSAASRANSVHAL